MKKRRPGKAERVAETLDRRLRFQELPSSDDAPLHASIMSRLVSKRDQRPKLDDVDRAPSPGAAPVPNAQWNEITNRWERWDKAANEWVAVPTDPGSSEQSHH